MIGQVWAWLTDPAQWSGPNGIPVRLVEHLRISGLALLLACLVALPVAVWLGHVGRGGFLAVNVGNVGRAIPTYALLVIFASMDPIGVGETAAVLALAVFALPPLLTNTYVAMRQVDPEVKDAARGMGMTGGQLLRRVELPLALPFSFAGLRTTTVQVVATATFAALVGGGGLGRYVVDGFGLQDPAQLYGGVVLVALLSVVVELLLAAVQRRITRRTRTRARAPEPEAVTAS